MQSLTAMMKDDYYPVYIEWIDSTSKLPIWHPVDEFFEKTKTPSDTFKTFAYLVNENKLEYMVASSVHISDGAVASYGQVFTIPKGCVTKFVNLTSTKCKTVFTK